MLFALLSCDNPNYGKVDIIELPDVFNINGRVSDYTIDMNKPKVVAYFHGVKSLDYAMSKTPKDKINKIISENPDYEFIYYIGNIQPYDTTALIELFNRYNMRNPVMLDYNGEYKREEKWTQITLITDKKNIVRGVAIIGVSYSPFDSEFANVKNRN